MRGRTGYGVRDTGRLRQRAECILLLNNGLARSCRERRSTELAQAIGKAGQGNGTVIYPLLKFLHIVGATVILVREVVSPSSW